ncbi:MAG: LPXTG cell wall anchor domain-containing protein [Clostridiaceae bacterium]
MKKLFTLVLALAMVFAIAAPAMAAWNAPDATVGSPFAVKTTAVQANTDAYGNTYYTAFPANGAVVAGTPVLVMIEITLPSEAKMIAQYGAAYDNGLFDAYIDLTNLKDATVKAASKTVGGDAVTGFTTALVKGSFSDIKVEAKTAVYTIIVGATVKETKAAKFEAFVGYSAEEYATDSDYKLDANFTLTLAGSTASIEYAKSGASPTDLALTLDPAKNNLVGAWKLTYKSVVYKVLGSKLFADSSNVLVTDETLIAELTAALKVFTDKLGFVYGDVVYFTAANLSANFGLTAEVSDFVEFKPYTSSLTVSDTAAVPNTGDSISVIGFVMVGLALLATAAVVVKKVRA